MCFYIYLPKEVKLDSDCLYTNFTHLRQDITNSIQLANIYYLSYYFSS
jgi:hypothetical protein